MINEELPLNFPGVCFFLNLQGEIRGLLDGSLKNCLVATTNYSDTGPSTRVLRGRKIGGLLDMLLAYDHSEDKIIGLSIPHQLSISPCLPSHELC
jgi:hypothetical protein